MKCRVNSQVTKGREVNTHSFLSDALWVNTRQTSVNCFGYKKIISIIDIIVLLLRYNYGTES